LKDIDEIDEKSDSIGSDSNLENDSKE